MFYVIDLQNGNGLDGEGAALSHLARQMSKTAEEILAHPRFAEARRAHIDALVGLFADNRFVTRLMIDSGTIMLRALLVGFHVAHDEDDRTTWATLGQVQNVLVERGLASARRVEDLVARFRQVGYVVSVESPSDIRVRILKPTEQLLAHDRDHLAVYHRFLYDLYPDHGHDWTLRQDPRVHFAIRKAMFLALDKATVFTRHQPIMTFLSRNAGYCAFLLVAQAALSRYPREQSSARSPIVLASRERMSAIFLSMRRPRGLSVAKASRVVPSRYCHRSGRLTTISLPICRQVRTPSRRPPSPLCERIAALITQPDRASFNVPLSGCCPGHSCWTRPA
jgi:hypothetical protein